MARSSLEAAPNCGEKQLSMPHLIDVGANGYSHAPERLMVVGQQTLNWADEYRIRWNEGPSETVKKLIRCYDDFALGVKYPNSPFWIASRQLCRDFNGDDCERSFLWSNLVKIAENRSCTGAPKDFTRPFEDVEEIMFTEFNVLAIEIKHAVPDVVVFFTGPYYEDRLEATFPGRELVRVRGRTERELCLVNIKICPHCAIGLITRAI